MSNVEQDQKPVAEVTEAIVKEEKSEQDVKDARPKGVVPEHLAEVEVVCVLLSDEEMRIPAGLMQQSKTFRDWVC